jgi:tetratricopeptide (TPR) repeat protein
MDGGFYTEMIDLLQTVEAKGETFPMLYYYLGFANGKLGKADVAFKYYQTAASKPHDYCFPFRAEENVVLNDAIIVNPTDAKAPYYLGNLLFEKQPQKAIEVWEKSAQIDPTFFIVHRNLSIAYNEFNKDIAKALVSIEKAYSCNNQDEKLLQEVDVMMELNNVPIEKKYNFLKKNEKVAAKRSETMVHFAIRCFQYGKFDEAVRIMNVTKMIEPEGGTKYQSAYLNAYTLRGMNYFNAGKYEKALADFLTASKFPVVYGRNRFAQLYYLLGIAYEKTGNKSEAKANFEKTIKAVNSVSSGRLSSEGENLYYKGMAYKKLGETEKANAEFDILLKYSNEKREANSFFNQFDKGLSPTTVQANKYYLAGLAYLGFGEQEKANIEFKKTLELLPDQPWCKIYLSKK